MRVVMTIAGSDSGAGAGIQADLKTIMSNNLYGVSVITAITAQNTLEVKKIYRLPLDIIKSQLDVLLSDFEIGAIKTGMLYSSEIIEIVVNKINSRNIPVVVDPVLRSSTGKSLVEGEFLKSIKEKLIPQTTIITPNLFEAEQLSGVSIITQNDIKDAGEKIIEMGVKAVLIKGGHFNIDKPYVFDTLLYDDKSYFYKKDRIKGEFHGIGCTFSSSIACNLAKGYDILEAIKLSEDYIEKVINNSFKITKGLIPINQKINE
ncbi:MAG: bifunctional hydroxymethylpyrimidine kinase/phosphomethylpyrimidine kinase [Candidatus Lokiarchaeota archaeon]|nr:bifunctional hydroxymethylpyrimidine kinase/phosphomethylpyrimidine kinase [Candidatus Lokiarchaeota archaeon]